MDQAPNNATHQVSRRVDARGLECPQPLLLARTALKEVAVGEIVVVVATDPHAALDFEVFCMRTGHEMIDQCSSEDEWTFWLRKS